MPVRTVARHIAGWVAKLGLVWVEGQVAQLTVRPGAGMVFLVLRDPVADVSLTVTAPRAVVGAVVPPLAEGARVVVHARPDFYLGRGTLSLAAVEIRPVGLGELLARLERLKAVLAAEGLFELSRKRPLPFLPRAVGLVCGRGSAAERDVLENARRRWPAVRFVTVEVAVQGPRAAGDVADAVRRLDADTDVDVIVIARGGGSVEDLLPFSEESLLRAVAAAGTPVVSAIGHEQDSPLLDLVADVRASTPTDAGRRVVPDVAEQVALVAGLRSRGRRALQARVDRELHGLARLLERPVLADPVGALLVRRELEVSGALGRARRATAHRLDRASDELTGLRAQVAALSPAATLARGYAVVQDETGAVVRGPDDLEVGAAMRVRLADGQIAATRTA